MKLYIKRFNSNDDYTIGEMCASNGDHLYFTIEPPWKDNLPNLSCVPDGTYETEWYDSPSHGPHTLQLKNVIGRSYIQIHVANWAHELKGCIALGNELCTIGGKMAVKNSRMAATDFKEKYLDHDITLVIRSVT